MRWIGASIVVICCGYFGFAMAIAHRKDEKMLRQIICAINFMESELQYRLTPLPQLLLQAANETNGFVRVVLSQLADELNDQVSPEVQCCMDAVLLKQKEISRCGREVFHTMGQSLGRFDLQGQLMELDSLRLMCRRYLSALETDRDVRLRSYKTLGLCAGATLAILFL
jgi:stage III sporulation protein AB